MTKLSFILASKLGLTVNGVREYLLGRPHSAYKVAQAPATAQISSKPRTKPAKLVNGFVEINNSKNPAVRFTAGLIQQKLAYMEERDRLAEVERAKARRRAAVRLTRKVWNISKEEARPNLGLVALRKAGRALIEQAREAAEVSKARLAARIERRRALQEAKMEAKRILAFLQKAVIAASDRLMRTKMKAAEFSLWVKETTDAAWGWYKYKVLCPAVRAAMLPQVGS